MKVNILASGSNGNCIALTVGNSTILVDAGIAKTKIEKRLLDVGIVPTNVVAIFITHAHKDHTKGLPLANKYNIPVYAGEEEWKDIQSVGKDLVSFIGQESVLFDYEGYNPWIEIIPFDVHHDAYEPKGYVIQSENSKISICLDTGKVDREMIQAMQDSRVYIIESNHEPRMVEASTYPDSVKARILSDVGHLSNKQTADTLSELVRGVGEQIYLTHLSSNNNMPALAEMTTVRALKQKGLDRDKHYKLEVI
ncbi:MBL fold metallo-hydrolase [Virgibacillus pantothenticus]|uniref:Beta-lactamase n=1 Tax=Virgibacillus pantothenticus TaxID=1473 RepID=A0A0L0QMA2_VIRPA|nr:MBL fold metallo-hydrolase [Virgibacillus pantothenticus]KNE19691.1 beta-lactamase [Virgibacillus pantothenticus]MED3735873.1 MBL fold metallo-hydrolase [Virgibacillus pantothenticus]QTY14776.1 MBL fold metallo-hydrolase [Virgibacillus pantothenticus]SIT15186.1 Phosphoribosyl 1,2-cyclic phosphodiesterase [Virgibacillus pantothenticus]